MALSLPLQFRTLPFINGAFNSHGNASENRFDLPEFFQCPNALRNASPPLSCRHRSPPTRILRLCIKRI